MPTLVTAPVKVALVVTLPAVKPAAVPVMFVPTNALGVPRAGVTSVGLVANTNEPVPVSSVTLAAKLADVGVARKVATPVPKPLTPVEIGRPVAFVSVAEVGVPRIGVTSVGLVDSTVLPVPVLVVTPVPPLATAKVPAKVIVPAAVIGPPEVVRPVVPPDTSTLVTVPVPPAEMYSTSVAPTFTAKTLPALPAYVGNMLLRAPAAVVAAVPPFAIGIDVPE